MLVDFNTGLGAPAQATGEPAEIKHGLAVVGFVVVDADAINLVQGRAIFGRVEGLGGELLPGCEPSPVEIAAVVASLNQVFHLLKIFFGVDKGAGVNNNAMAELHQALKQAAIQIQIPLPPEEGG